MQAGAWGALYGRFSVGYQANEIPQRRPEDAHSRKTSNISDQLAKKIKSPEFVNFV
jgi:hypothetical protein